LRSEAFGVPIDADPRALAILHEWVKTTGGEMNEARLRLPPHSQERGALSGVLDRQCNRDSGRALDHAGDAR
jgi:hypothetical protein